MGSLEEKEKSETCLFKLSKSLNCVRTEWHRRYLAVFNINRGDLPQNLVEP